MKKNNLNPARKEFMNSIVLKKLIFIIAMAFFTLGVFAKPPLASKQQIGMFKNSKTCVVLDDGGIYYNVCIKDAVQKYWKSTDFEFIDQKEFEKRRFDSKYSFIVLMKNVFDKDPGGVSYDYLSLVLGDATNDMTNMPELCCIPISYSNDDNSDYGYAIPAIIKFMEKHVKNLETKRFRISLQKFKYYNGSTGFKDKVLLLKKSIVASDADTPEKIKTVYPYYVKLLTTSEIETELSSDPTNAIFIFHVGPAKDTGAGKCFNMIFDIDGKLYYYNSRKVTNDNGDSFNLNDFSKLRKIKF
ncbi:MAG: hypothetical protein JXB49_15120 [Bacteroidales bacterium]|nr:hypothetical protein [Bacteroidales bacterium]